MANPQGTRGGQGTGSSDGRNGQPGTRSRGFAAMDAERQREIASEGGRAAHMRGTAHEFDSEEARAAGRKGGEAVSQDRRHMAAIGRLGGQASRGGRGSKQKADARAGDRDVAAMREGDDALLQSANDVELGDDGMGADDAQGSPQTEGRRASATSQRYASDDGLDADAVNGYGSGADTAGADDDQIGTSRH